MAIVKNNPHASVRMGRVLNNIAINHHLKDFICQELCFCFIFGDEVFVGKIIGSTQIALIHVKRLRRLKVKHFLFKFDAFVKGVKDFFWGLSYFLNFRGNIRNSCYSFLSRCLVHRWNRRHLMMSFFIDFDILIWLLHRFNTSFFLGSQV